jgi:guanylate kinase
MTGKVLIFSAPSGAGKTTLVKHLLAQDLNLAFSVSACSRDKRPNEENAKDYYFMTKEEFREKIAKDEFLEWEEVYDGNYYGTLKAEIDRIWASGKHVIFDVDVVGGMNLKKHFGDKALAIYVEAPSIKVLEDRLRSRKTENEETIKKRIDKAKDEIKYKKYFDLVIVNDDLAKAKEEALLNAQKFLATK